VGNGAVSIDIADRDVLVGRRYCMTVTYTAGRQGVAIGGCLRFRLPGLHLSNVRGLALCCSNPNVVLRASNEAPAVDGRNAAELLMLDYLFVRVEKEPLREGDTVSVRYGDALGLIHTCAPRMAQRWRVEVATDLDGCRAAPGSGFYLVPDAPALNFVSDRAFYLEVTIPASTQVGEAFETVVRARDRYHNICTDYAGTVELMAEGDGERRALGRCAFTSGDSGVHVFARSVFDTVGVNRVAVMDEGHGLYARSNPSRTTAGNPRYGLFWGDTHCHSSISRDSAGINSLIPRPTGDYDYARNRADLDFCMVTDHIENQTDEEWRETCEAARTWYEPGRFVTFSGFEVSFPAGDRNVYFTREEEPRYAKDTLEDLYGHLRQLDGRAMVIPHQHVAVDWTAHHSELERVTEVYSHWGCGLSRSSRPPLVPPGAPRPEESYVHYALDQGARLGFIASADHSYGHPGDDFWWGLSNYTGGLAAVYAPALTRQGIWDGLWSRHCYGTTRARILLEVAMNGHLMGEELTAEAGSQRRMRVSAHGTTAIDAVEIVRNGRVVHTSRGDGALGLEFSFDDRGAEAETDYYYVHVTQVDGEQAWSSPIWVTTA